MMNSAEGKAVHTNEDRTLKDLSVNAEALLCYVVGWVSGIVFLLLEQKSRFIRFHAIQSIITFGSLALAGSALRWIPYVGGTFSAIIGVSAFILWIVLMIKAYNLETFKLPWVGNLAEKLAFQSMPSAGGESSAAFAPQPGQTPSQTASPSASAPQANVTPVSAPRVASGSRKQAFRARYYSPSARTLRIVGSSFAIAFSLALLVFFNFFHQYIGYYQPVYSGGHTYWQISSFLTSDFNLWLPVINTALIMGIIGHAVIIAFDRYLLREGVELVLDMFGLAAVVSLLAIFPFDFSVIPNVDVADAIPIGLTVTLILVAVGFSISILVRFIRLIVHAVQGEY